METYLNFPDEIKYLIFSYVYHNCNIKNCKTLTRTFCLNCRNPVCTHHYHLINSGMCENCIERL